MLLFEQTLPKVLQGSYLIWTVLACKLLHLTHANECLLCYFQRVQQSESPFLIILLFYEHFGALCFTKTRRDLNWNNQFTQSNHLLQHI